MEILQSVNKNLQSYLYMKPSNRKLPQEADTTEELVEYYIPFYLRSKLDHSLLVGLPKSYLIPPRSPTPLQSLLAKLCFEMEDRNSQFFEGIPVRLAVTEETINATFLSVSKEIIQSGINWGRVMSLFTFCAVLSRYFMENKKPHLVVQISELLKDFLNDHVMLWITANGGWDDLSKKMGQKSKLWTNALVIGGIWATTYLLISGH